MTTAAQADTAEKVQQQPEQATTAPTRSAAIIGRTLNTSPTIAAISAAIAKAQITIAGADKSGYNKHMDAKYSRLDDIWNAAHKALNENGVAIIQSPTFIAGEKGGVCYVTTALMHSSGEFIVGEHELSVTAIGAQAAGSAMTYLRKYSLSGMTGVSPSDDFDDDGQGTKTAEQQAADVKRTAERANKVNVSAERIVELNQALTACATLEDLQKTFESLTDDERVACEKTKNALKVKLSKGQKSGSSKEKAS